MTANDIMRLLSSQLVSRILSSIVLIFFVTRFDPSIFAQFSVFIAIVTLLWLAGTLRFEQALLFEKNEQRRTGLLYGTILLSFITTGVFFYQ